MNQKLKQKIQISAPRPLNQDTQSSQIRSQQQSQEQQSQQLRAATQPAFNFSQVPKQFTASQYNQQNVQQQNNQIQSGFNFQGINITNSSPITQQIQQSGIRNQKIENIPINSNSQIQSNQIQPPYANQGSQLSQFNNVQSQNVVENQGYVQQPILNAVQFQNPSANQNIENNRIYNYDTAQLVVPKFKNTILEEFELALACKDKSEAQQYFRSNIQSLNSCSFDSQPNIFDLPKVIERTKIFCQKNQNLAKKLKQTMENLLMYDNKTNHEACFDRFCQLNNVPPNIQNFSNVQQELSPYQQQQIQVSVPFDANILQQEIQYLAKLNTIYQLFDSHTKGYFKSAVQIEVKSLPIYSIFLYNFLIKQRVFHITVEYQDYYFFESITQQKNQIENEKFLALLLYAFKCEQRLFSLVYSDSNCTVDKYIDFDAISQFFQNYNFQNFVTMQIQIGNPPDYTKRPLDKYQELLQHYEKGCKSQIFNFIIDGKWPENSFQKNFDDQVNVLRQFQLWLIWMRQMQEKIIDFQLFIRAKVKQGSMDSVNKEFSLYFSQKLKQFYLDIENSIYSNLSKSLYCISHNVVSQEKAKIGSQVKQIIYSMQDQSKIMTGNIICKRNMDSCCFYFKDVKDQQIKKVLVTIIPPQQLAQQRQISCQSDFSMRLTTQVDRTYQIYVTDQRNLNAQLQQCGKFYDTLLINQLIQLTRKNELHQDIELGLLLSQIR
ncbi:hypothetical protein TTHERM_00133550 (macronuclear) [Tetrahymena thermophila SB210]|uniref:Uncharacterized protein n=1 Tax=Tetrahymena thermophila (strain SB210) TaxID=312017 RepID=I7LVN1_TETTS|nr:hypothetical protein TTHERM_00133550 [Tetrahymena thermophila SB210]EAR99389.2 hypothetical protein TTHERM_00133550 [Tetrahymena thermophila SB210]|eukprot:XP_001019634.2 hypothetical protein TTHERM_00133550 [Tetrahymena thermophila SB210]